MSAIYVKPYVKRHKNDAADAEAICEAVTRPNMRFVATKTPEQQSCLTLHRTRQLFIRQQTAVINAIRAHLAEFGIVAPVGRNKTARAWLAALGAQQRMLMARFDPERTVSVAAGERKHSDRTPHSPPTVLRRAGCLMRRDGGGGDHAVT